MDLNTSLNASRDIYLAALCSALQSNDACHVEPALRDDEGGLALDGVLNVPYRPDLILEATGESVMVDSPTRPAFAMFSVVHHGIQIDVSPFVWDYTSFRLQRPKNQEWAALKEAFLKWFDVEDENEATEDGFFGVVHYLSDPTEEGGELQITVDFGSAPIDAFHDVLGALCVLQPEKIIIG